SSRHLYNAQQNLHQAKKCVICERVRAPPRRGLPHPTRPHHRRTSRHELPLCLRDIHCRCPPLPPPLPPRPPQTRVRDAPVLPRPGAPRGRAFPPTAAASVSWNRGCTMPPPPPPHRPNCNTSLGCCWFGFVFGP
ncbi:unnamed protein product, partial [Ectocarpus sp. 12 AP-2014]